MSLIRITRRLCRDMDAMRFSTPVAHVYNPIAYAREPYESYLRQYCEGPRAVVLLGMNPGPFGMVQTGVPFGDVAMVRDWLGISGTVRVPANTHPKRPVQGFDCTRSEVSGSRLWGWARDRFGRAEAFFARHVIINYCPLAFVDEGGRNVTPDKLAAKERAPLLAACDDALARMFAVWQPEHVVGIGIFAEKRAREVLKTSGMDSKVGRILHPSPGEPQSQPRLGQVGRSRAAGPGDLGLAEPQSHCRESTAKA